MNRMTRVHALAGLLLLFAAPAWAQEQQASAEEAAMMAAWQAYMTPGDPHQHLVGLVGQWEHKLTMWMAPGAPPTESTATSTVEAIMGDRYIAESFTGSFMGMPFEGQGLYGYDNAKQKYFMTWVDNMGTGIMIGWGEADKASHSITYTGTFVDPMTKEEKPFRSVIKHVAPDHSIMEMYMPAPDGTEFKTMEIHSMKKTS